MIRLVERHVGFLPDIGAVQVLDGVVPQGKRDVSSGSQRSDSMVSRLVQQLCKYMVRGVTNQWFKSIVSCLEN